MVELLLLNGVDSNVKTETGETMLGLSASSIHCQCYFVKKRLELYFLDRISGLEPDLCKILK